MKIIDVEGFKVGGSECYIIADVGSNHMQDITLAKESILAAKESGVNAVKFQSIQVDELYLNPPKNVRDFVKKLEFPENWHQELKQFSDKHGVTFFSSPTYLKSIELLSEQNVSLYKLASAQIGTFPQLVDKVAQLQKPTIFSTGIANYEEVIQSVNAFRKHGNDQFIILHCNSLYPCPADKVNLPMMQTYASMFDNPVGFSDHTVGTHISCAAVSMGAKVIEKHFTLDRGFESPDSNEFACDPTELTKLVREIRDVESSMVRIGDRMSIQKEEQTFKEEITYRLVSARDLKKGDIISSNDIQYLRSLDGINCKEESKIVGQTLTQDIEKDSLILSNHLAQ